MSGWRDRLNPASFRNVPFLVESSEVNTGRRLAIFQYPNSDHHDIVDLGKKARGFTVVAYALGDDYDLQEAALLSASEKIGAGELIHPAYGSIFVRCISAKSTNSRLENGVAVVEFTFVAENVAPDAAPYDTTLRSEETSQLISTTTTESFKTQYAAIPKTRSMLDTMNAGIAAVGEAIRAARKTMDIVTEFSDGIVNLIGSAESLALDAIALGEQVRDVLTLAVFDQILVSAAGTIDTISQTQVRSVSDLYKEQASGLIPLLDFNVDAGNETSEGISLLVNLVRVNAVASLVGCATRIDFTSVEEANQFRDQINDALEKLSLGDLDDDILYLIEQAHERVVSDLEQRSLLLPRIITKVLPMSIPSLVLANDLYGSIDREQDILDRNNVSNPLFVPAMRDIQVLTDV